MGLLRFLGGCKGLATAIVVALVASGAYVALVHERKVRRFMHSNSLFHKDKIVDNFRSLDKLDFDYVTLTTANAVPVAELPLGRDGEMVRLPRSFEWNGTSFGMEQWLQDHWTTGLVVIKRDSDQKARMIHERYFRGNDAKDKSVSWSMCKTIVSALMGIAVDQGIIGNVEVETITDYVPELIGSGYENVTIEDVLQMSSGVAFNEDYFDPFSDINQMGYVVALGWSIDSFVASLKSERHPGQFNHYVSMDTQALAMVLMRAAGMPLSSFAQKFLWEKVGFESEAIWLLDNEHDRMELAFGVLGITARDYARIGWLYLNKGVSPSTGERVLSESWVERSLTASKPHLRPGEKNKLSDYPTFGYGYQIWLCPRDDDPDNTADDYMAIGVYGQLIYVSPRDNIVIAKTAADPFYPDYQHPTTHENYLETQGFRAMRTIARAFRDR